MAAGILMAIIVISTFFVMYNNVIRIEEIGKQQNEIEIIEKFNEPFMSYNKRVMYGTDLISVLNLALDNNNKYNVKFDEEYYVDILFKLNDNLYDITDIYILDNQTGRYNKNSERNYPVTVFKFTGNRWYSIHNDKSTIESDIISHLSDKEQITYIESGWKRDAIVLKYAIKSNFIYDLKRKTFTCTNVEVDSEGKIKSMSFEQK